MISSRFDPSDFLTADESLRLQIEYIHQLADTIPSRLGKIGA